jgi:CRISPR-associated endonuclease/helicase Cas3
MEIAFRLWAKTNAETDEWHSVPCHLIDVGATAGMLWDRLSPSSKAVAIRVFGSEEIARRCVMFLAATHDLGKINRFFQAKDRRQLRRLADLGVVDADETRRHGEATTALLQAWLAKTCCWSRTASSHVAIAIGGHHGVFRDRSVEVLRLDEGYVPLVASALLKVLYDLYQVPSVLPEPKDLNPFLGWLAGFVSVADWLGSHDRMTTIWCNTVSDLSQYRKESEGRASCLFASLDWLMPQSSSMLAIADLTPKGFSPNHLQRAADEIARTGFGLAIVEAPTGEGKTEAAFVLCETGRSKGDGVFIGLPTMATANGIYDRVNSYLRLATGADGIEVRLLHSQAWISKEDLSLRSNPTRMEKEGTDDLLDIAEDWFAGGKRGLIAPYGVGTIDQCLVGALQAKHGFVRLFALAGKTVVIDEVHAYDVYMSDLLERLLGWLRKLGCRVILLSATLPVSRRRSLIDAWGGREVAQQSAYPCITWVDSSGEGHSQQVAVTPRKPVRFELLRGDAKPAVRGIEKLLGLIRQKAGFGALIVNTVKEAQEAFEYLKKVVPADVEVDLFHARFTMEDRAKIEGRILSVYGKSGSRGVPRILIATQVVEQSLDLDFDYMVSALAPIDLLIQRAGRLHRHRRDAFGELLVGSVDAFPDMREAPTFYVLSPVISDSGIKDPIYAGDVLLKTYDYLELGCVMREPKDVSAAVDWVYDRARQSEDRAEWLSGLDSATEKANAKRARHHALADEAMICAADDPSDLLTDDMNVLDENDDAPGSQLAARTRLEELPSVNLILLKLVDAGNPVSYTKAAKKHLALRTVRAPAYGACLQELNEIKNPVNWALTGASKYAIPIYLDDSGQFETESYRFTYDPIMGLRCLDKNAEIQLN